MLGIRDNFVKVLKKILLLDQKHALLKRSATLLKVWASIYPRRTRCRFRRSCRRWFRPDLIMVDLTSAVSDGEIIARQLQKDRDLVMFRCFV